MEKFKIADSSAPFSVKNAQALVPIPQQSESNFQFVDVRNMKDEIE